MRGIYQRTGIPVSNSATGRAVSASGTPSSDTWTCRELRNASTRWFGPRGCTNTSSSSSYQWSMSFQANVIRPRSASQPAGACS